MEIFNKIDFRYSADEDTISIVIPVYKDYTGLDMTLNSISERQCGKYKIEIIVVNDGGQEEIADVCREYKVNMVDIRPNCGAYLARNKGLEYSSGAIIVFTDADVILPPGWLEQAVSAIETVDYLAAAIRIDSGGIQTAVHSYQVIHSFPITSYLEIDHFGVTAGLVVKRRLVEQLGGFDSRLRSGGDKEFGVRVYQAGIKQGFLSTPPLNHPPKTLGQYLGALKRIKRGHEQLAHYYPGTFTRPTWSRRLGRFLRSLLPPWPVNINSRFYPDDGVSIVRKWFFLWLLKFFRGFYELRAWEPRTGKPIPLPCPQVTFFDTHDSGTPEE